MHVPVGITNLPRWEKDCRKIHARAQDLIDGRMNLFEAGRALLGLARWTRHERDPEFAVFLRIDHEAMGLPVGQERAYWAAHALTREDVKIRAIEQKWKAQALESARHLVEKFRWALQAREQRRLSGRARMTAQTVADDVPDMANEAIRVEQMANRMDLLPVVARWIFDTWWQDVDGASVEALADRLREHRVAGELPLTLVALNGEQPVGTATLLAHDVGTESWPHLSPWMAAVYVEPESRRRGVGSRLVQEIVACARTVGIRVLYLQTSERQPFYERLGWHVLERTEESVVMMRDATAQ